MKDKSNPSEPAKPAGSESVRAVANAIITDNSDANRFNIPGLRDIPLPSDVKIEEKVVEEVVKKRNPKKEGIINSRKDHFKINKSILNETIWTRIWGLIAICSLCSMLFIPEARYSIGKLCNKYDIHLPEYILNVIGFYPILLIIFSIAVIIAVCLNTVRFRQLLESLANLNKAREVIDSLESKLSESKIAFHKSEIMLEKNTNFNEWKKVARDFYDVSPYQASEITDKIISGDFSKFCLINGLYPLFLKKILAESKLHNFDAFKSMMDFTMILSKQLDKKLKSPYGLDMAIVEDISIFSNRNNKKWNNSLGVVIALLENGEVMLPDERLGQCCSLISPAPLGVLAIYEEDDKIVIKIFNRSSVTKVIKKQEASVRSSEDNTSAQKEPDHVILDNITLSKDINDDAIEVLRREDIVTVTENDSIINTNISEDKKNILSKNNLKPPRNKTMTYTESQSLQKTPEVSSITGVLKEVSEVKEDEVIEELEAVPVDDSPKTDSSERHTEIHRKPYENNDQNTMITHDPNPNLDKIPESTFEGQPNAEGQGDGEGDLDMTIAPGDNSPMVAKPSGNNLPGSGKNIGPKPPGH